MHVVAAPAGAAHAVRRVALSEAKPTAASSALMQVGTAPAAPMPTLVTAKPIIVGVSREGALPQTAIRGRATDDRIEPTLSHRWLPRSVIVVSSFIGPEWLPEQLGSLHKAGVDEDDEA